MIYNVSAHYDALIDENNDPVFDSEALKIYMNRWDGAAFVKMMDLDVNKSVLEIGVGTGRLAEPLRFADRLQGSIFLKKP